MRKLRRTLGIFGLVLGASSFGLYVGLDHPTKGQINFSSESKYIASSSPKDIRDVEEFKRLVERIDRGETNITTVKDFLKAVPSTLRDKYTLVYGSRSLQQSSLENPRALVFSRGGEVIYSFNGDPRHQGYHQIEMMYLDYKNGKIVMKELQFSGEPGSHFSKTRVVHNPESCVGCHGSPSKPLWDAYRFWPGVYGSNDDFVWRREYRRQDPEWQHLQTFREREHPRYDLLKTNSAVYSSEVRPNLFLNMFFLDYMTVAIIRELMYTRQNESLDLKLKDFLSIQKDLYSSAGKAKYVSLSQQLKKSYKSSLAQRFNQSLQLQPNSSHYLSAENVLQEIAINTDTDACRELLLEFGDTYKLDVRKWSNDLIPASLTYNDGGAYNLCMKLLNYLEEIYDYKTKAAPEP